MESPVNIDQIDAMRMGVDYRLDVSVRGFKISVRPLTIQETMQVTSEVQSTLKGLPITAQNALTENVLLAQETLERASTSGPGKTDYQITKLIMQSMTPDELNHLYKQYVTAVDKVNPSLEKMDKEQMDQIVDLLKKSPPGELGLALIELSFLQIVNLAEYLMTPRD